MIMFLGGFFIGGATAIVLISILVSGKGDK